MFNFSELDRAIEATNYDAMAAAMSRAQRAQEQHDEARAKLQVAKRGNAMRDGIVSEHSRQLHKEQVEELEKLVAKTEHDHVVAGNEASTLRSAYHEKRRQGRVETHRRLTVTIINAAVQLKNAITADQRFRAKLKADMVDFQPPLSPMLPDYKGGGPAWIDGLAKELDKWLPKMDAGDAYKLVSRSKAAAAIARKAKQQKQPSDVRSEPLQEQEAMAS